MWKLVDTPHGVSLEFGGMLTAEVRRGFYKTRQGSPLGGDELAATAAFLESAKRLKTSIEGVTESGRRPRALVPLRAISGEMITHSELAEKIRGAVEETGEFRDNASPELRRARAQKGAAEGKLKKAMQGKGTPTTHQGRMVLAIPAPAPPDVLVVGTMAGGALVLIEPPKRSLKYVWSGVGDSHQDSTSVSLETPGAPKLHPKVEKANKAPIDLDRLRKKGM